METTFERVKQVLVDNIGVEPEEVLEASTFDSLGADSLDQIEVLIALENEFGIMEIPDEEAIKLATVADVVKYVDAEMAKRSQDPEPEEL